MRSFQSTETGEVRNTDNPEHITQILRRAGWVEIPYVEPPVPEPEVPESVEAWALREHCRLIGMINQINAGIDGLPEPPRAIARDRWEYKPTIRRNDPMIATLASGLGLTKEQVDNMFIAAQTITLS